MSLQHTIVIGIRCMYTVASFFKFHLNKKTTTQIIYILIEICISSNAPKKYSEEVIFKTHFIGLRKLDTQNQ